MSALYAYMRQHTVTAFFIFILILGAGFVFLGDRDDMNFLENISKGGDSSRENAFIIDENAEERIAEKRQKYPSAVELVNPAGFINLPEGSDAITLAELIGKKVILLDIWTYSCINCQRTLPYITDWYSKYQDKGLEIIGVHSPEFEFEKNIANVVDATKRFGIEYPVVLDNDFGTWHAYQNNYWPRKYLIDIDGFVIYDHIGEGGYEETERLIQEALMERTEVLGELTTDQIATIPLREESRVRRRGPLSPEVYFGASRNSLLENGTPGQRGELDFSSTGPLTEKNKLYFDGRWNITEEYSEAVSAGSRIRFKYDAQDVFMVAEADSPIRARILRDGQPLTDDVGSSVFFEDGNAYVLYKDSALYSLIKDDKNSSYDLEIIFEEPGVRVYTFTFG